MKRLRDIDKDKTYKLVKKYFGDIPRSKDLDEYKKKHVNEQGGFDFKAKFGQRFNIKGQSPNPAFLLGFKGVKITTRVGFVLVNAKYLSSQPLNTSGLIAR